MAHCLTLYTKTPSWLKKVGMTRNEATVYCVIYDYIRNGLPAHPTYAELAEELWSDDTSPCPTVARNAVSGLIEKGFIAQPFRGNSHGRANEYTLLVTLYELFQIVDRENPGYFSDAQRAAYEKDLNIEISHSLRIAPTEQSHQDRPANNIPTQPTASRLHRDTTLPAKPVEQETTFYDDFLNDCGLNDEQSTPKVETVTVITKEGEEIEVLVEQPDDDVDDPDVPENEHHNQNTVENDETPVVVDEKDMDPQQRAYNKQNNAAWSDDLLADIPF